MKYRIDMKSIEKYRVINDEYIGKIASEMDYFLFAAKKWAYEDYLWPFSDFDYRIVIKDGSDIDFFRLNEILYIVQLQMQTENPQLRRIMEHPPGYIFFESEIMTDYLEDFRIWSFAGGNSEKFFEFKNFLDSRKDFDQCFYQKIIEKRYRKFSFKTEYRDYTKDIITTYEIYCVLWHYYFPCMFAIQSLKEGRSKGQKIHKDFLKPGFISDTFQRLHDVGSHFDAMDISFVIGEVEKPIAEEISEVVYDNADNDNYMTMSFVEAMGMMRTRIARLRLYLEQDKIDRHYLAIREIAELNNMFSTLYQYSGIGKFAETLSILHLDIREEERLRMLLRHLYNNRMYYNDFMNCTDLNKDSS